MLWEELESELVSIADRVGIEVRHVRYEGEGGLCVLRGKRVLVVNDSLSVLDRVSVMAGALAGLSELEEMYVLPEVRELLEKTTKEGQD